jgi:hypothetical protein
MAAATFALAAATLALAVAILALAGELSLEVDFGMVDDFGIGRQLLIWMNEFGICRRLWYWQVTLALTV